MVLGWITGRPLRSLRNSEGGFAPLPNLPPGRRASRRTATGWAPCVRGEQSEDCAGKAGARITTSSHEVFSDERLCRLLENLADPPPLLLGQGPRLLDQHAVAHLARVGLIVGLELLGPPHDPLVARVAVDALDEDHASLGHLVAHHHT